MHTNLPNTTSNCFGSFAYTGKIISQLLRMYENDNIFPTGGRLCFRLIRQRKNNFDAAFLNVFADRIDSIYGNVIFKQDLINFLIFQIRVKFVLPAKLTTC